MTAPDLKPCPFCGGDKNMICRTDYDGRDSYAVSCRYPECHGAIFTLGYGYFHTEAEAIAAWNTRAVDPAADRIEELVSENYQLNASLDTCNFAWDQALRQRDAAEAKLAKAVDAIKVIIFTAHGDDHEGWHDALDDAQKLITELEKTE